MSLRCVGKILPFLLLASSCSFAATNTSQISCPPVNIIKQAGNKIDKAVQLDEAYIAFSSAPVFYENGNKWHVTAIVNAKNRKDAIRAGRKAVEKISFIQEKVEPGNGEFECRYGPFTADGLVEAVTKL